MFLLIIHDLNVIVVKLQDDEDDEDEMDGSDDDGSDNDGKLSIALMSLLFYSLFKGPVLLGLAADLANGDNNANNGNEEGGNADDGRSSSSDDNSWSSISLDTDDPYEYESDSSALSAMEDLLFEY